MQGLIEQFWVKHAQLQHAVSAGDYHLIHYLDREIDPLLKSIVDYPAETKAEARLQFDLVCDLLERDADDGSTVLRYCATLRTLAQRYLKDDCATVNPGDEGRRVIPLRRVVLKGDDGLLSEAILNSLPDRVTVITPDYRYLYANSLHSCRMDETPMRLVGRHVAEFMGFARFERRVRPHLDACFAGQDVDYTFSKRVDDRMVVVRCRMTPCRAATGKILGAIVVVQEMADRRRAIAA